MNPSLTADATRWPRHDAAWYHARLAEPRRHSGPLAVLIDTDAANEIDDQFALCWALQSPQQLNVLGVYATPFSFEHRRHEMMRARRARDEPALASAADHALLPLYAARLQHFLRSQWPLETIDLPVFNPPGVGMQRSFDEILVVFDKLKLAPGGLVFRGSDRYLPADVSAPGPTSPEADNATPCSAQGAVDSEAARHLIATARAQPLDQPLYVLALGCVTNIASALLMAPDIVDHIVVVWTSGFPSHAPHPNHAFNLEQDMCAARVLLDSGVPLVYLPGYHVGAQLRLSLPEMERHVQGRGAIGDYLHHLFTHNPLWDFVGIDSLYAHSWVIWDVINVAWMIEPDWVPSSIVATPRLGDDKCWQAAPGRHPMREAYGVARDAIFRDFFLKLEAAG